MLELLRSNDPVLISAAQALLDAAEIGHFLFDQHASIVEGSLGVLPRRLMIDRDDETAARRLLTQAGLGAELRHGAQ
ncbi:MAG: DUF2007 domain-containing protein [Hyphomicrobiales bacterium]|nr:DUF2007 domain-containing protein [Hyphomicrobiales bacterium]OQW84136.1 MAG: hypothetical protein BVN31_04305 [Proteobacteria bacterium ST_bin15]